MRYIALFAKILLFLLLFAFAVQNTDTVVMHGLLGARWELPLIVLALAFFVGGVLVGVLAMLAHLWGVKRELSDVRKALRVYTDRPVPKHADQVEPAEPLDAVV